MNRSELVVLTDEQLASRAQGGSAESFEELVRRYQVPLLRFLQRRGPRPRDAEDVLQESFLRAYESLERFHNGRQFKTWLFTLTYRLAISLARKRTVPTHAIRIDSVTDDSVSDQMRIERQESGRKLWDLARQLLSDEQFDVLWLHYSESMPARQIAEVMNRSWVWVKTSLHRSRRKLLTALEPPESVLMGKLDPARGEV